MKVLTTGLLALVLTSLARADVTEELARMLSAYPEADANRDGNLTEEEAGNYFLRAFQQKRANRGPGFRDRALVEAFEARIYESMPYRLLAPLHIEPGRRYPLIVSLHGSGGIGDDNLSNLCYWNGLMAGEAWRESYPCVVLVPQRRPGGIWGPKPDEERVKDFYIRNDLVPVFELIELLKREFSIDEKRIYVLGASGGGVGTWNILMARPDMFAAAITVCGHFTPKPGELAGLTDIPIWCFHGDADPLVDVKYSREAFAKVRDLRGNMKYTELRGVKHNAWVQAFSYQGDDPLKGFVTRCSSDRCDRTADVWQWLFRQRRP